MREHLLCLVQSAVWVWPPVFQGSKWSRWSIPGKFACAAQSPELPKIRQTKDMLLFVSHLQKCVISCSDYIYMSWLFLSGVVGVVGTSATLSSCLKPLQPTNRVILATLENKFQHIQCNVSTNPWFAERSQHHDKIVTSGNLQRGHTQSTNSLIAFKLQRHYLLSP